MNPSKKLVKAFYKLTKNREQKSYWKWLLDNAKEFHRLPLTPSTEKIIRKARHTIPKMKCYYNAQMLAIEDNRVKYYEGYAVSSIGIPPIEIPIEHAFNVVRGKVIDVTWSDGDHYFGVYIPTDFIRKHISKTGMAEKLLGHYFEIVRRGRRLNGNQNNRVLQQDL